MSDVYVPPAAPPPPPPPPPPPRAAQPAGYDFLRPFVFVFDDPRWLPKILIGGLFVLLSFILIGLPFLFGYVARLVRNVIAGVQYPLPEWDDLGEYFGEGLLLFCVGFVYVLPLIVLGIAIGIPAALIDAAQDENVRHIGGGVFGCAWCLMLPFSLAVTFFVPAAMLRAVVAKRFGAAFEFSEIWAFIRANMGNYLLAIVVYFVARMLAGAGIILLCIGVIFTEFWGLAASGYAFAQVYRLSPRK